MQKLLHKNQNSATEDYDLYNSSSPPAVTYFLPEQKTLHLCFNPWRLLSNKCYGFLGTKHIVQKSKEEY